jgi:aminobenzoyl-glutamate transport protein
MLPYSLWLLAAGTALMMLWVGLDLPLGPNAPVQYQLPVVPVAGAVPQVS